jgi:hypothetical protein
MAADEAINEAVLAEVNRLLESGDSLLAIGVIEGQGDPAAVMRVYAAACDASYWKRKDLSSFVLLARAGIQFGLTEAKRLEGNDAGAAEVAEAAAALRGQAKALAYNLGSHTWPGWDEQGIEVTSRDVAIGLDAARLNLRLARELERGPLPMSRAHWLLGAQLMASGRLTEAEKAMQESANEAAKADNEAERLLSLGYVAVAKILSADDPRESPAHQDLADVKKRLGGVQDGEFFAQQLDTALSALSRRRNPRPE